MTATACRLFGGRRLTQTDPSSGTVVVDALSLRPRAARPFAVPAGAPSDDLPDRSRHAG